jgi:hypothetical protein
VLSRLALSVMVPVLVLGAGCTGSDSKPARPAPSASVTTNALAEHTPDKLRHPCDIVDGRAASRVLQRKVTAHRMHNKLMARALDCSYVVGRGDGTPALELRSTPDPTPLLALVGLYVGTDRLRHHPVDVPHADAAVVIIEPGQRSTPTVTLFAKQGFTTHTVVVRLLSEANAERAAIELASLVVAGNR